MQSLVLLLKKDLLCEWRARSGLSFIISLSILLAVFIAVGVNAAYLDANEVGKIFPSLVWIVFFLVATLVLGKSFDIETENRAIDGLLLTGVSPSLIYLSKIISGFLISLIGHLVSFFVLAGLLNVSVAGHMLEFLFISAMSLFAYCALACLTVPVSQASTAKSLLLPLMLLPLLFPMFFASIELSFAIFSGEGLNLESIWVSLLLGLDVIYIVLGLNLYTYVIRQ